MTECARCGRPGNNHHFVGNWPEDIVGRDLCDGCWVVGHMHDMIGDIRRRDKIVAFKNKIKKLEDILQEINQAVNVNKENSDVIVKSIKEILEKNKC